MPVPMQNKGRSISKRGKAITLGFDLSLIFRAQTDQTSPPSVQPITLETPGPTATDDSGSNITALSTSTENNNTSVTALGSQTVSSSQSQRTKSSTFAPAGTAPGSIPSSDTIGSSTTGDGGSIITTYLTSINSGGGSVSSSTSQSSGLSDQTTQMSTGLLVAIIIAAVAIICTVVAVMTRYTQTRKKRTKKIGENEQAVRSRRRLVARPLTNSGEYMADSEYDEREREREQNEDGNEWIGGYQSGIDLSAAGFQKNSEPGIGTEITRFQGLNLIGGVVMERGISEVSRGETTSGETRPPSFELADSSRRVLVLVPMYNISTLGQTGNMHRPVAVVVRDNSHVVPVESLPDILNMAGSSAVVSSLHSSDH